MAVNYTLNSTPFDLSNIFWGTTVSVRAQILPNEAELVNATQTQMVLWPGASSGDTYDPLGNVLHGEGGISLGAPPTNEAQFVRWCESIHCQAIFQVPGEINDTHLAAAIVNYTEINLGFRPAYWEIGNEPDDWKHFDQPWNDWGSGILSFASPMQYANEVAAYITAMDAANNGTPFKGIPLKYIGIPAAARPRAPYTLWQWMEAVVQVNGPRLAAIALHEYPAGGSSSGKGATVPTLQSFYAALTNNVSGLPARIYNTTNAIDYVQRNFYSGTKLSIPIFVTEVGTALSHRPYGRVYSAHFAGALDMIAEITQAMTLNITNADIFGSVFNTTNSWLTLEGAPRPAYVGYTQVLNHLGSEVFPWNFGNNPVTNRTNSLNQTLFGIGTLDPKDRNRSDLLVVNANVSYNVSFRPQLPDYDLKSPAPVEVWYWNGTFTSQPFQWKYGSKTETTNITNVRSLTPSPVPVYYPKGLPANWVLPPQSLVLFESYNVPAAPVFINESGLPSGTVWFLRSGTGSQFNATTGPNLTVLAPLGTMPVEALATYLPDPSNDSRYVPDRNAPTDVTAAGSDVSVGFVQQWRTSITPSPSSEGAISPEVEWANASRPLELTAYPMFGYGVSKWVETEQQPTGVSVTYPLTGNYTLGNGTVVTNVSSVSIWNATTSVTAGAPVSTFWPNGFTHVQAIFARAYPVVFTENGLASGTNWAVTLRSGWNDTEVRTNYLAVNRTLNGNVSMVWDNVSEVVSATQNTSSVTTTSITNSLTLVETNRTYGFTVDPVAGYRSLPVGDNFTVAGGRVLIAVNFTRDTPPPLEYPVTFVASGLPNGTLWSVTVRNQTETSNSASLKFDEANGSYGYVAATIPGFQPHPAAFGFVVNGAALAVPVTFSAVRYNVIWIETGLGNLSWSVNVSGQVVGDNSSWVTARLTNGTYAFTIPNAQDYIPQLRSGSVTVNGQGQVFNVTFVRASFPVTFEINGDPPNDLWYVRLSTSLLSMTDPPARFTEPNGSYTFNITPPVGYIAVPSHGVIAVDGAAVVVPLSFVALGSPALPPIWDLALPALGAAAVIALAGWGTFRLAGARRRRRSGAKP